MSQQHLRKQVSGFLNTPPLWQNQQFGIQQFAFPEIDLRVFQPKAIPSKIRLGHQMEYVFKQLIDFCKDYEVLLHNLAVKNGKRTIGEIDFILKNRQTSELLHIELTYKFYVIDPSMSEPTQQLMGPNRRDMFFTKMEKIKNDQFELLHSKAGTQALLEHHINPAKIKHQACYKAQLFVPYECNTINIKPLNSHCISGRWMRFDDFRTDHFKEFHYYIPFKSEWVIEPHIDVPWNSHFETLIDLNLRMLKENSPMVWMKRSATEYEKCFVVWW